MGDSKASVGRSNAAAVRLAVLGTSSLLAACASGPEETERVRFAIAGGYGFSSVNGDRRGNYSLVDLDDAEQLGGFVEATSETGEDLLAIRLTGGRERHDASNSTFGAEFTQFQALAMLGRRYELGSALEARALFGVGVGYAELDYDDSFGLSPRSGISGSLAGALELEAADHVFAGVMGWYGVAGYISDTECEFSKAMLYLGVRF